MPNYSKADISAAAEKYGFQRDTFEKVLRLVRILGYIQNDDFLSSHLLLKGGTAINLTIFKLPRLSVDIDLDYTPNDSKEETQLRRTRISERIKAYLSEEGYQLSESSRFSHSLDLFHFQYQNASGNRDTIKIELNYSLRAHVLEPTMRELQTDAFSKGISVETVHPLEKFAAKTNALFTRAAARDLYDFNNFISTTMRDNERDLLRKTVIFYASISREKFDGTFEVEEIDRMPFSKIRRDLFPVLMNQEAHKHFDLGLNKEKAKKFIGSLLQLTQKEQEYVECFKNMDYRPELLFDDPAIVERIRWHPMALWKCRRLSSSSHRNQSR